ncbi:MAG: FecR domain-containing protein [Butyricimonas paravirosa]
MEILSFAKGRVFVFENERLDDILQEMARWYDFDIFYQNPDIADNSLVSNWKNMSMWILC